MDTLIKEKREEERKEREDKYHYRYIVTINKNNTVNTMINPINT